MCGMTPTQFWYEEPRLLYSYLRKHEIEQDENNYKSWLFGLYTHKAVLVAIALSFAEKGAEIEPYFQEPLKELMSDYVPITEEEKGTKIKTDYRKQTNYWAKLGKKGGK